MFIRQKTVKGETYYQAVETYRDDGKVSMPPNSPVTVPTMASMFTFRFNRRRSQARGLLFYWLLQQAVQLEPVPFKKLVGGKPNGHPQI